MSEKSSSLVRLLSLETGFTEETPDLRSLAAMDAETLLLRGLIGLRAPGKTLVIFPGQKLCVKEAHLLYKKAVGEIDGESQVVNLGRMLPQEGGEAKMLLLHKILEDVAVRSGRGPEWRRALNSIGNVLYTETPHDPKDSEERSSWLMFQKRKAVAIQCIIRTVGRCLSKERALEDDQHKISMANEILAGIRITLETNRMKIDMDDEILAGSLFLASERDLGDLAKGLNDGKRRDMIRAAAFALATARETTPRALIEILFDSIPHDERNGQVKGLVRAGRGAPVPPDLESDLIAGFRQILSSKRYPHPWFEAQRAPGGIIVPKLDHTSILSASFYTLSRIRSGAALGAMVDGIGELILPTYSFDNNGEFRGIDRIESAGQRLARMLANLATGNHFANAHMQELNNLVFGVEIHGEGNRVSYERTEPSAIQPGTLLSLTPLTARLSYRAALAGGESSPVAQRCREALVRGFFSELGSSVRQEEQLRFIDRNIKFFQDRCGLVFGAFNEDDLKRAVDVMSTMKRNNQLRQVADKVVRRGRLAQ